MAGGDPNDESMLTEILNLNSPSSNCPFPSLPSPIEGAVGGLVNFQHAIVCGGYYYGDYSDDCLIGSSTYGKLKQGRAFGASVTLPDSTLWITGGKGGEFGSELSSTEIISANTIESGIDLPVSVAYHCIFLKSDESRVVFMGGYIEEDSEFSNRVFEWDLTEKKWYVGTQETGDIVIWDCRILII